MARVTLTGATGPQGPQGERGFKGDTGARGADGVDGVSPTLAVGTTTTGAAGTSASVVNTGTSTAAVFAFTIPRGDTGAKGDKGDAGANGSGAGTIFTGALFGSPSVSSQTITCGDPYTSGNPSKTYTTAWLPGAAEDQNSTGSRRSRAYSTNETYYYSPLTTDVCMMLAPPRTFITGYEHYQSSGSTAYLVNASTAETGSSSLNRFGWTSNPAPERRVIYVRQDSTGGRQFIMSPVPNGGQPLVDTTPYAVSRIEIEWADFLNGWTLVSAPGVTTPTFRPSGPQWKPLSGRDASMSRFTGYYHRDYPTATVDTNITLLKHASTTLTTLMGPSGGKMWTFLYAGTTDAAYKPGHPYLMPTSSGSCQLAIASGGRAEGNTVAQYFADNGNILTTGWPGSTATTPSTSGGVIGRSAGIGGTSTQPFEVLLGALHEIMHPVDIYCGFLAGRRDLSSDTFISGLWNSYIKSGAAGYGSPTQATISGSLRTGTRILPASYGAQSEAEFFAEAGAALYYWNSTGDYHGLRIAFGAHVAWKAESVDSHYWVDRAADLVIVSFVDWWRTNIDASIGTYTPVPAGTTPPVLAVWGAP